MKSRRKYKKQVTALFVALSCIAVSSIGDADNILEKKKPSPIADQELFFAPVPKAVCGPGDKPETALQGQVTAAQRAAGFEGASCNVTLIGWVRGEGASWQNDEYREGKGKNRKACAYHSTAAPTQTEGRTNYGTRAIDITDPSHAYTTAYLTTPSMLYPHESLKANHRRQLLGAIHQPFADFDVYDVSGDCRYPQLLATVVLQAPGPGTDVHLIQGHEGNWAPDGLTYYGSDISYNPAGATSRGQYYAIDTTDTTNPRIITSWQSTLPAGNDHGLSLSDDGNRGYFTSMTSNGGVTGLTDPAVPANNGLLIYDLTEIQARKPNPQAKLIGSLLWKDGTFAQMTIPVKINGKPYVIFTDEGASGGFISAGQHAVACAAGMPLFPMARIIDISDERNPKLVSKLMLEIHDPANCDQVAPDIVGGGNFVYGSHYCSVDNKHKATTLACGYFGSGIRVFDIRDPVRPREIAYYNSPALPDISPGSSHAAGRRTQPGGPDLCQTQLHLDADLGTLWTTCMDYGLLMLKFTHNAWPFAESSTPAGMQN